MPRPVFTMLLLLVALFSVAMPWCATAQLTPAPTSPPGLPGMSSNQEGEGEPTAATPLGTLEPSSAVVKCSDVDYKARTTPLPVPRWAAQVAKKNEGENVQLQYLKYGTGLTTQQVYEHVSAPAFTPFIDSRRTMFSCIDGRDESYIVSTPGGDAAEFIVALTIFQRYGGQIVTPTTVGVPQLEVIGDAEWQAAVSWWLADFLASHTSFDPQMYMHTDEHAAQRLAHFVGLDIFSTNLLDPPSDAKATMLTQVTNASHIGCGHIRLMASHPDIYGVPKPLPKAFVYAFYQYLWYNDSSRLALDVLEFSHTETAVLQVLSSVTRCGGSTYAPMIQPKFNNSLFFVDHPTAVLARREAFAEYFAPQIDMPVDAFVNEMTNLAVQQLQLSLAVLARTLPVIQILYVDRIEEEILIVDVSFVLLGLGIVSIIVKFPVYSWQFLLWSGVCVQDAGSRLKHMVEEQIHLLSQHHNGDGDEGLPTTRLDETALSDFTTSHLRVDKDNNTNEVRARAQTQQPKPEHVEIPISPSDALVSSSADL